MRYIVTAIIVALLAGCGGGGGGGSTTGGAIPTPSPPVINVQTRQIQAGDRLVYTISANVRDQITGTAIISTSPSNLQPIYGYQILKQVITMDLTMGAEHSFDSSTSYLWQAADGTIMYLAAEDGSGNVVTASSSTGQIIEYPSPISVNRSWSYDVVYSNGHTKSRSCTLLQSETVQGISTYCVEENLRTNDGQYARTARNYHWFAPSLGYPINEEIAYALDTGVVAYISATLQSKNF